MEGRTGYIIFKAQYKMKMWVPLKYLAFQDGKNRALNQWQDPVSVESCVAAQASYS